MRVKNWPSVLARFIETRRNMPFAWGTHDCALFAADAVKAITGVDHAALFRGLYDTRDQAEAIVAQYGGLRLFINYILGPEIDPKMAQRGDVALILDARGQEALAVCIGASFIAPAMGGGLTFFKLQHVLTAWRAD